MAWLVDPVRRGELYPLYHQLRRVAPVYKNRPEIFHGAWSFTRFAETDVVFRSAPGRQRPAGRRGGVQPRRRRVHRRDAQRHGLAAPRAPPARAQSRQGRVHTARRSPAGARSPSASPTELCDRIEADGKAELVEQYNYELPFNVIAHILGIPEDDFPHVKALAWDFARRARRPCRPRSRAGATTRPARSSRTSASWPSSGGPRPGDDLLSSLLEAEADGERSDPHRARRQLHPVAAGRSRDHPGPARQRAGRPVPPPRPARAAAHATRI